MTTLIAGTALVAAGLLWLLMREFNRIGRERRMREATAQIRKGYLQLVITVRDQFTPALRKAARDLDKIVSAYTRGPALRAANQYRKGGLPHVQVVDARECDK